MKMSTALLFKFCNFWHPYQWVCADIENFQIFQVIFSKFFNRTWDFKLDEAPILGFTFLKSNSLSMYSLLSTACLVRAKHWSTISIFMFLFRFILQINIVVNIITKVSEWCEEVVIFIILVDWWGKNLPNLVFLQVQYSSTIFTGHIIE